MLFLRAAETQGVALPSGAFAVAKMLDGMLSQQLQVRAWCTRTRMRITSGECFTSTTIEERAIIVLLCAVFLCGPSGEW